MTPQLWFLAGGNGAGKSTFYRTRLAPHGVEFVNADLIERTLDPGTGDASYAAAALARRRFADLVEAGRPFCYETVFSHGSKLELLLEAKRAGYHVNLVVIRLASAELNVARVAQRVSERGHDVPVAKILARLPRTHALLRQAYR